MRSNRKPAAAPLEDARADFRRANFHFAVQKLTALLDATPGFADAALLLARVHLRVGNPSEALAVLTRHARSAKRAAKGEAAMLKGVAFARLGDTSSSRAQFRAAQSLLDERELSSELLYHQAASEWIERRLDRANKLLDRIPPQRSVNLDLHIAITRGAIASAAENLPAQGAILLDALRRLRTNSFGVEVYLYAMLVTHIAALAVELPSTELRDAALAHVDAIAWTDDISDLHFHAARAVAWRHALEGDEFNAFRRLKEALTAARSDAWRVAALTDRAYLAAALGEPRWAAQELRDAHELASTIDWNGITGEEKLALPVLAELFAERDPSVALSYVTTFTNVGKNYPRILSSRRDRRVEALEAYSLGKVQLALGEHAEAKRLLKNAWSIYDRFGIAWRAARAALGLAEIDDKEDWRARALSALSFYPRSWLAREHPAAIKPAVLAVAPEAANLTAAQRAVFELLLDGRGTDDIARALARSTFTVRNHIKAIFKAFNVSSRSALIVKATRGSSQA